MGIGNIVCVVLLHGGDLFPNGLLGGGDAGEVGEGGDTVSLLDGLGDLQGVLTGTAPRAVGDADKGGLEIGDLLGGGLHRLKGGIGLGGEHLKGEGEAVAGQQLGNLHGRYLVWQFLCLIIAQSGVFGKGFDEKARKGLTKIRFYAILSVPHSGGRL